MRKADLVAKIADSTNVAKVDVLVTLEHFFVEVKKSLEGDDFKTCIMHEMVHVKQQARDEFQPALQKMEDEAYEKQEILLERWKDDK